MQTKAAQTIKLLTRTDFYEMLIELSMLIGPEPTQRDKQDAQAFLDILLPPEGANKEDLAMDANLIQQRNRETMNVFTNLVKALLLHEVDPTL